MSESIFKEGLKLNVTKHIEKKGRFSYLSWAWAVQELRKLDPKATWEVKHFQKGEHRQPYMETPNGFFVEVVVTMGDGISSQQIHPVLDNSNKTIMKPNAFQINTSIQRCLVKAIALASGIGLHIYAGEDLPPGDEEKTQTEKELTFSERITKAMEGVGETFVHDCLASYQYNNADEVKEEDKEAIMADLNAQRAKVKKSQSMRG